MYLFLAFLYIFGSIDPEQVSFWFSQNSIARALDPPSSLQRLLLCREMERVLLLLRGQGGLRGAYGTIRQMLQEEVKEVKGDPQEAGLRFLMQIADIVSIHAGIEV